MHQHRVGLGMNAAELEANPVLSEWLVQDLNKQPELPFSEGSFDVVTNVVSIDYLIKPIEIMQEQRRILRPGGLSICSFSNRMFWTKAIELWTQATEWQRVLVCAAYFSIAGFQDIHAYDVTLPEGKDPLFIVQGTNGPVAR